MSLGPLDGPYPGRPRGVEGTLSNHTPTPEALLDEELLHDAGLAPRSRVPGWVWVVGALAAVVVLLILILS